MLEQVKLMQPFAKILGLFDPEIRASFEGVEHQLENLKTINANFERFSEIYSPNGWCLYDEINTSLVGKCISVPITEGEETLIEEFLNPDSLERLSFRFYKRHFDFWQQVFGVIIERISNKDYISATPLIFIIIDGIFLKHAGQHPFSEKPEKTIFDCLTSKKGNLENCLRIFGKTKRKLDTNEIDMPFRHGVMHGLTPNYGNKIVAAKAINLLWATINYFEASYEEAARIDKARKEQAPPKFSELVETMKANARTRELLENWQARPTISNSNLSDTNNPVPLEVGTPEERAREYIAWMMQSNFGRLAGVTVDYLERSQNMIAGKLKQELRGVKINRCIITGVEDEAPAISVISVILWVEIENKLKEITAKLRCIYMDNENNTEVRGEACGQWKIMPMFIYGLRSLFYSK